MTLTTPTGEQMRPPPWSPAPTAAASREAMEAAAIVAALTHVIAGGRTETLTQTPAPAPLPAPSLVVPPCPWASTMGCRCHHGHVTPAASQGGTGTPPPPHIVSGTSVCSPAPVASPRPGGCSRGSLVFSLCSGRSHCARAAALDGGVAITSSDGTHVGAGDDGEGDAAAGAA
jgi:hypothetical protein